jgi:hypothetical protein
LSTPETVMEEPAPVPVIAPESSRLASLVAEYQILAPQLAQLTAQVNPLEKRVKELKAAIATEARTGHDKAKVLQVHVHGSPGGLQLKWSQRRRFNVKEFQTAEPLTYALWCVWDDSWAYTIVPRWPDPGGGNGATS